jgi:hypothetical protein
VSRPFLFCTMRLLHLVVSRDEAICCPLSAVLSLAFRSNLPRRPTNP